jgi:cytoskeletal protein CcmA (bactofilin family)
MNLRIEIKGELTADEDVTIEGRFEGAIDLRGHRLTTGAGSDVKARVSARAVTVQGRLEGHVTAESIEIRPTAVVEANLITRQFALEEGGRFNGQVNTERARAAGDILRHRATGKEATKGTNTTHSEATETAHSEATEITEAAKTPDPHLIRK